MTIIQKKTNTLEQNLLISSGKFEKEKTYWLKKLSGQLPIKANSIFFFEDCQETNERRHENPVQEETFYFPGELYKDILRIGNHSQYGVFIILAAGLSYLVSKYFGEEDIILGTPILAQDKSLSCFNEILPLRNNVIGEKTFKDFLFQIKQTASEAFENMNYPLEKILKQLDFPGEIHQLYDTVMVFKNIHGDVEDVIKEHKWGMVFSFDMTDEYLGGELYHFSPFNRDNLIIDRFWGHFLNFFRVVTASPGIKLMDIDVLDRNEREKILYQLNDTEAEYPQPGLIHRLFEEQVDKTPDNTALAYEDHYLTYIELNRRANRLAGALRQEGIRVGSIGGIMMERSIDQVIAVLSLLKADAVFIALDPKYPENRLEFLIKDTNLQVILTPAKALDTAPGFDGLMVNLNPGLLAVAGEHDGNWETDADIGERPAYIIYTSGSTGKPKGVLNLHKGVINRCNWMWKVFPFKPHERCCQKTSTNFVDSIWEKFGPLLDGVPSVIVPDEIVMDVPRFIQVLKSHRVTRLVVVPSLLYRIFDSNSQYYRGLSHLTFWVSSGEELRPDFPAIFRESFPGSVLLNIYGPSETSADNTYYDTTANRESFPRVPIGHPIDNTRIYILDKYKHPVPFGVSAEIYIGGVGLAAGYLNRPELTAEKFDHDLWDLQDYHDEEKNVTIKKYNKKFLRGRPDASRGGFFKKSPPGGRRQRIYSTGDLGRYLPDGTIEYIARKDQQVKIRGFRIEPGEVESFLLAFNGVKEALVVDKTDKNKEKYLCAYVVMGPEQTLELREMRRQLALKLPDYMVPSFIVPLDKIPLTATGKVHRQALPEPHEAGVIPVGEYIPPRDDIERKLVEIWSGLLEVDKNVISIDSNFFEIGGHSLRAVTLISIIHKEFNVELQLGDFFLASSIRQLGQLMGKTKKTVYTNIEPLEKRDYYELSSAQKRMYVIQQIDKNSKAYNMTNTIRFVGTIDIDKFEEVFQLVIQRHESLRTYFQMKEGEPVQRVHDKRDIRLKYLDAGKENINTAIESFEQSFDLSEAPLSRAGLIKLGKEEHIFVVNINHIISDGITVTILMRELGMLYNGDSLPYLNIQYKDFASWQNTLVQSGEMSKQERYWLEKYRNGVTILDLPTDYARTAIQSFTGSLIHFDLDEQQTEAIKHVALRKNATLFMVLLSAFNILMAKLSGQEEIVLGTPVAGRNRHKDLEQLIGLFLNTLLLENSPRNEKTFDQFFKEVKENTIEAFENQDFQFENLVDKIRVDRNASRNPLFDVMFVLRNMEQPYVEIPGLKMEPYEYDNGSTKLDILLNGIEFRGKLCFYIRYCTKIYKRTTIERLIVYFRQVLDFVLEYPGKKISEIEMIPEEERKRILFDFNDTNREYPGNITLQELFQGRAAQVPDRSAVVYNQRQLTYTQLNERVNRLAHYLRDEYHVKSNHVIGVSVDRSLEMIIAVWGIIKSGAGYVAIDPNYPRERVDHILKDSRVQWVITDKKQSSRRLLEGYSGKQIDILGDWEKIGLKSPGNPPIINQPDDLLYVIYTSGSTGIPNGAKLSHDLLTNLICWQENHTCIDSSLRVLQFTTINFCVSFQEIMCTLTTGGQVYLIGDMERQEIDYLMNFLIKHSIEVLYLPFSYLNFLFNESNRWHEGFHHTLKHIITAGEQLKISRSMKIFLDNNPGLCLHNHYGSSEMHVVTSFTLDHTLAATHPIPPAGKPIANTKIYILDDNLKPVPIGAWGELFVESRRELLGYVHNEALTREKMVHLPALSGKRLYRSGDIGRWLEDGNIQLGGRKDCQVKVRGFRVEPGEIESKILSIQEVKDCVVVVREDKDLQKSLYAYVVLDQIDIPAVKEKISSFLPQYMLPRLIRLDSLPLMPNGKVDRENLPGPSMDFQEEANRVAPRNQVEKQVALIWQEVLGIEQVGIHTSFFDLGGNSLRSIKVNNKLKEVFQKDIPLVKMFEYTTIGELAQYLDDSKEEIDLRQVQLNKMVNQAKTRLKKIVKHR